MIFGVNCLGFCLIRSNLVTTSKTNSALRARTLLPVSLNWYAMSSGLFYSSYIDVKYLRISYNGIFSLQ